MTRTPTTRERSRFGLHRGGQIEVWQDRRRFKVVAAGRRWGKTQIGRAWLLAQAQRRGAGRYWYVAPTREDAKDIMWADLKAACHPQWLREAPRESDLALILINGAEVRLWSAEKADSLRGRALRAMVMDEYADMDPSIYHEILRPALADYRAPALFIGTPKSFNHFYDLYERGQNPEFPSWGSWQFKSLDNPCLDREEIEEARRESDPRTFRQEWEASFEALAGRAYYAFARQAHVAPVTLAAGLPVCVSFDFNVNPATAIIGQPHGDEPWFWREVFLTHLGGEATRACALKAQALLREAGWDGALRIYGDPAGKSAKTTGPSDHAVLREVFPTAAWCIGHAAPHVRDRVAAMNARFVTMDGQTHCRIDPSCAHLISDCEQVVFLDNGDLDKKSNPMLTHVSDAAGYWVHAEFPVQHPHISVGRIRVERFL
jgi:hypothetical protein